jgi:hypothetical protein
MLPTTLLEDLNEGLLAYTKVLIDLFQKVAGVCGAEPPRIGVSFC